MALELGRLENVGIREVWLSEPTDFTPWLLANADLLSKAIGINLTLTAAEHPVGSFSLDLIGEDDEGRVVIVENQLEQTDHTHLGQIMTYWAGTGASTVVWVSPRFREEHKRALETLNDSTTEGTSFFGVEINAVKIGDSQVAPIFTVVVGPTDWGRATKTSTRRAKESVNGNAADTRTKFWYRAMRELDASKMEYELDRYSSGFFAEWVTDKIGYVIGVGKRNQLKSSIQSTKVGDDQEFLSLLDSNEGAIRAALPEYEIDINRGTRYNGPWLGLIFPCRINDESRWDEYLAWLAQSQAELRRVLNELGLIEQIEALGTDETPAAA